MEHAYVGEKKDHLKITEVRDTPRHLEHKTWKEFPSQQTAVEHVNDASCVWSFVLFCVK